MGCYVDKNSKQQDTCVISDAYSQADTYYLFNHVDIVISYRPGNGQEWGQFLTEAGEIGGRIVCEYKKYL